MHMVIDMEVHMHMYMHTYACIHMPMHTDACKSMQMYICTCIRILICSHIGIGICNMHPYMYVYIHADTVSDHLPGFRFMRRVAAYGCGKRLPEPFRMGSSRPLLHVEKRQGWRLTPS